MVGAGTSHALSLPATNVFQLPGASNISLCSSTAAHSQPAMLSPAIFILLQVLLILGHAQLQELLTQEIVIATGVCCCAFGILLVLLLVLVRLPPLLLPLPLLLI